MTDSRVTPQAAAVEAAAKALVMERSNGCCGVDWPKVCDDCDCFRDTSPDPFYYERKHAEAVLAAAAPLLCQPLQDEIDRLTAEVERARRIRDVEHAEVLRLQGMVDALLAAVPVGTE